jgi:hypothetical protein
LAGGFSDVIFPRQEAPRLSEFRALEALSRGAVAPAVLAPARAIDLVRIESSETLPPDRVEFRARRIERLAGHPATGSPDVRFSTTVNGAGASLLAAGDTLVFPSAGDRSRLGVETHPSDFLVHLGWVSAFDVSIRGLAERIVPWAGGYALIAAPADTTR